MTYLRLEAIVGSFAENKDVAAKLRNENILPALDKGDTVKLDFNGITLTTQSFIHALISEGLRRNGEEALENLEFIGCNDAIRGIIETVVQYVLETVEGDS
jgi:hypothetical protein